MQKKLENWDYAMKNYHSTMHRILSQFQQYNKTNYNLHNDDTKQATTQENKDNGTSA